MTNNILHSKAYDIFRYHLDQVYSHKGEGNVYGMSVGYPAAGQFELPMEVLREMMPIQDGHEKPRAGYGWEAGSLPVREAIVEYENLAHEMAYTLKNVCIVAGATYGLNRILEYLYTDERLKNNRNELLVVAPSFYRMLGRASSYAKVVSISGREENKFQITISEILRAITPKTKAVFLLNPSNPTYLYFSNKFLEELVSELSNRGIYLIIDESGDAYVYGHQDEYSYHKMTNKLDNEYVIRIVTASKKYLLAEYRIGYVLASESFIGTKAQGFIKLIGDDLSNPPLAANDAWLAILRHEIMLQKGESCSHEDCDFLEKFTSATRKIAKRREETLSALRKMKHIKNIIVPDANFNLAFSFDTDKPHTDIDIFKKLVDDYDVAIVPGSGLGIDPSLCYFRLTFAIKERELRNGLDAIKKFTESSYL